MEEGNENEVGYHQDQGANCGTNGEEADETNDPEVSTGRSLLQRSGVDKSLGIDVRIEHEEQIIAVG